jgi:DNA-binding IclR family transcriptional regulator
MRLRSETAALLSLLRAGPGLQEAEVAEQMGYSTQNARKRLTALAEHRMVLQERIRPAKIAWRITHTGETALGHWEALRPTKVVAAPAPRGLLNSVWALGEHIHNRSVLWN